MTGATLLTTSPECRAPARRSVSDAMITRVKSSSPLTTVGELRELFADEHVHSAVVVDRGVLLAVVDRADLDDADDLAPALPLGSLGPRVIAPDADLDDARRLLLTTGRRRLAVVGHDGRLQGLLCLKRTRRGFCTNRDVVARSSSG